MAHKIRAIKTADGAIKLDIGADKPGDSVKVLEDILITLASASGPEEEQEITLPEMRIVDADILIGNEVDSSSIRILNANILVALHVKGARRVQGARNVFELSYRNCCIASADLCQRSLPAEGPTDQLAFDFIDPALDGLGALLPDTVPDTIVSEPMPGLIQLAMDKFFSIDAVVLDLKGKALSLAHQAYIEASAVCLEAYGALADSLLNALSNDLTR